ncbi:MAG: hypothetical protein JWM04_4 [Verrucomicrobiales bacterium]|nr:hypothetical protein [Verrucomicrobiales bacterium]
MKSLILPILLVVCGSASVAEAVLVTNVTTSTAVFKDNFESGNFAPTVVTWTLGSGVAIASAPSPAPPKATFTHNFSATVIPEPSKWALLLSAGVLLIRVHWHKARRNAA